MNLYSWEISLPILAIAFFLFIHWVRKTRWNDLQKKYPANKSQYSEVRFKYGLANIGGIYLRNATFSAITNVRIFIRKPFPFSLFMPAIFIPWKGVGQISIVDGIESRKKVKSKIARKLNPFKYADIQVSEIQDIPIAIIWKESYRKHVPEEKLY